MAWDIHVRRAARHGDHLTRVQARWTSLATIEDVWMQCGPGVRQVGGTGECRREMNAFSRPLGADFSWADDGPRPEVVLTWIDGGEACRAVIPLAESASTLSDDRRRRLPTRTRVVVEPDGPLASLG